MRNQQAPGCLLFWLSLSLGCASVGPEVASPETPEPAQVPEVETIHQEISKLILQQAPAAFEAWRDGTPWAPSSLLEPHRELFTPEAVEKVRLAAGEAANPEDARRLSLLARYQLWEAVALDTREVRERYERSSQAAGVRVNGETLPVYGVVERISREPDPAARRALWNGVVEILSLSAGNFVAVLSRAEEVGKRFAHPSGLALGASLSRVDLAAARKAAEAMLDHSESLYRRLLEGRMAARGVDPEGLGVADLPLLLRVDEHYDRLAGKHMLLLAGKAFSGLGLDLSTQQGVDTLQDPLGEHGRPPRAFGLRIPGNVRILTLPRAGLSAYRAFFYELGRAQHWAHTRPGPPELVYPLGYRGVSGAAAVVVESWLADPAFWIANGLDETTAMSIASQAAFEQLYACRRVAGAVLWLSDLAAGKEAGAAWRVRGARALGVPLSEADAKALPDRMDPVYALDELQARLLAATTLVASKRAHGAEWRGKGAAGVALFEQWSHGQRRSATELIEAMGGEGGLVGAAALIPEAFGGP